MRQGGRAPRATKRTRLPTVREWDGYRHTFVMNYEQAVKELQDNVVVMAEMERRQSAMLRDHAEMLREHAEMLRNHAEMLRDTSEFRRRTDQNLAEITDKLNGLIGYIDGMPPPRPA